LAVIHKACYEVLKIILGVGAGNTNKGGRLSTVDILIKVACFVKKGK